MIVFRHLCTPPLINAVRHLSFNTAAHAIPHPLKSRTEDAFFHTPSSFGIADGVGGWSRFNVDSGDYSRALLTRAKKEIEAIGPHRVTAPAFLVDALTVAWRNTNLPGGTTCCLGLLNPDTRDLHYLNIGDSGFLVVRGSQILYEAPTNQHYHDCPYQLSKHGSDSPRDALLNTVNLRAGDLVVAATDGLWDNVFPYQVLHQVTRWQDSSNAEPQVLAKTLVLLAEQASQQP